MNNILKYILPWVANNNDNKKIKDKIEKKSGIKEKLLKYEEKEILVLKNKEKIVKEFDRTMNIKDKLEDKGKTNVAAFTVSISLILGLSNLLSNISSQIYSEFILWIIFIIAILGMIYMIMASLLSMNMLMNENTIFIPKELEHFDDKSIELLKDYVECTELNKMQNLIRNNIVFTSYECIRNSIFCFFIVFLISILPINSIYDEVGFQSYTDIQIAYSSKINEKVNIQQDSNKQINELMSNNKDTFDEIREYVLLDKDNNKFIKVFWDGEWIIVKEIVNIDD